MGIPGNELVDQQAELAITSGEDLFIPAPYSHLKRLLKNYIVEKWNEYWNSYDSASGIRARGYINQVLPVSIRVCIFKLITPSRFLGVGFSPRPKAVIGSWSIGSLNIDAFSNSRVSPQFWKPVATKSMPLMVDSSGVVLVI
ncbi:hypothetical protein AVEN_156255-1 [Araneus ventricosus]|uniref:RNase H type-1 domain-containing protein n=1 Tax=Araneus ventricosus TaxID=182803 RepID=A0A4Y2EPS0_ARAVE|nr:hypothetical protein AVEN_156255-1 [Araneus ventricosus]